MVFGGVGCLFVVLVVYGTCVWCWDNVVFGFAVLVLFDLAGL